MPHINDHTKRHDAYRAKGSQAMTGKTAAQRFEQHITDTVDNVLGIIADLEAGTATFDDARRDVANYKASVGDIWKGIEHGVK